MADAVLTFGEEFRIGIPASTAGRIQTVGAAAKFIDEKLAA